MYTQNTKKQDSIVLLQLPSWMWTFKFTDLNSQQYQDAMNIMLATMLKLLYLALFAYWYELKMQNVNGHMPSNPLIKNQVVTTCLSLTDLQLSARDYTFTWILNPASNLKNMLVADTLLSK